MRLDIVAPEIESSQDFATMAFGIGNTPMIMEILRSKIYSNPLRAMVQELLSNARDANREAGRDDEPIEVVLPSYLDNQLLIKDHGLGITPSRMQEVFVLYGNSTKRGDNGQTGGFGLGAKTPFAIGDSFNITTITDDAGGRYRRQYLAYIDETRCGAVAEISCEPSAEDTGTTIGVAIENDSQGVIKTYIAEICESWSVRPNVVGPMRWQDEVVRLRGERWTLTDGACHGQYAQALVDGIPYPLRDEHFDRENEGKYLVYPFRLEFATGKLAVTASREELDYRTTTVDAISRRFAAISVELQKIYENKLSAATSLWEAMQIAHGFDKISSLIGRVIRWNGIVVPLMLPPPPSEVFSRAYVNGEQKNKRVVSVVPEDDNIIIEHDLPQHSTADRARIIHHLKTNKLRRAILIDPRNQPPPPPPQIAVQADEWLEQHWHWSVLGALKLSSLPLPPPEATIRAPRRQYIPVKRLERRCRGGKHVWTDEKSPLAPDEIYVIIGTEPSDLASLEGALERQVAGISPRSANKVLKLQPQWKPLHEAATAKLTELLCAPSVEHWCKNGEHQGEIYRFVNAYANKLHDPLIKEYVHLAQIYIDTDTIRSANTIFFYLNGAPLPKGQVLAQMEEQIHQRYPLLHYLTNAERWRRRNNHDQHTIEYLNLKYQQVTTGANAT